MSQALAALTAAALAVILPAAASASEAAAALSRPECPTRFESFRNAVSWYGGRNQILLEARTACGSRLGPSYELEDVTLTWISGGKVLARLHSDTGYYSLSQSRILIGHSAPSPTRFNDDIVHGHCFGNPEMMTVDLETGELRASGIRYQLNSKQVPPCSRG